MFVFISILVLVVCLLLILIVLVQNPKGGGLSSTFGQGNSVMGVRKTTDFLEKATWTLAIGMMVLCLLAGFALPRNTYEKEEIETEQTGEMPATNTDAAEVPVSQE